MNAVLTVLYRFCLDILYRFAIAPLEGYTGLTYSWNLSAWLLSLLAFIAFVPAVVKTNRPASPSALLLTVMNYFYFIPLTSYYGCHGTCSIRFLLISMAFWALLLIWQAVLPTVYLKPVPVHSTHKIVCVFTALSCLFVLYMSGRYTHFRFTLDLTDVYGIRGEAATYQIPTVFQYLMSAMPVALSVELLYWMQRKNYLLTLALIIVYLFLFSFAAMKAVFFFMALTIGCHFFYRGWMMKWFPGLMSVASLFALVCGKLEKLKYILHLSFVRTMYTPVHNSSQFMEFFQNNPLSLSRNGIMERFFFQPVYSADIPKVVGEYRGNFSLYANNGLLGPLFSDFPPVLGLLLLPLILVICFRLLDMVSLHHREKFLMPFCIYFAAVYMNSSWSVVLLSNGLLVAVLLLYFFPREEAALT